jgi:energy-coupling factor transporter ATP-binding protein EcfA2
MRAKISSISLIGAERVFSFENGLNIITGPIATGKTTLIKCVRGVFGSGLKNFPREARETISNIACEVELIESAFNIVRPFVTTQTAKVDIAGQYETRRLPALRATSSLDITYTRWLLEKLGLPVLEVPTAPTRTDSDSSPVSINDFMMYCYLRQDEIDNNVLGHTNYFKNIKRKYVFEIAYGKYNIELANLYDELRDVSRELSRMRGKAKTIEEFLEDTPFENKASIEWEVDSLEKDLENIKSQVSGEAQEIIEASNTLELRAVIKQQDNNIIELTKQLEFEIRSEEQLEQLLAQLETQSNRITRSIVAGKYLLDFDFVLCPRCGADLNIGRANVDNCYLCLQHPEPKITRDDLINEQDRLEKQIIESRELIHSHQEATRRIKKDIAKFENFRNENASELNFLTESYISDSASEIATAAHKRAEIEEKIKRLNDYQILFQRREDSQLEISRLESRKEELDAIIDSIVSSGPGIEDRIEYLEEKFREILGEFDAPKFIESGFTGIDRSTYLPLFEGRRFDELQSQGLKVIVNVAHILAHQLTSIEFNLTLPNILLIDGITANIGYEGLDWERVEKIFNYLISLSDSQGDKLQVIVSENSIPDFANEFVRVRLTEDEKLIPSHLLQQD